ncbi:hypothetical protein FD755_017897 [Muntiacus reevesi]|uniref:Sin3 histone deacetylase corepressor complex component SDS3 n=1 Tax=Muntiacus reevesi TaxID=9886 RepID=A0A5N3X889_MUNRE|nr:hypothetical protein FD755_017897 [Muntiacus reevesi]
MSPALAGTLLFTVPPRKFYLINTPPPPHPSPGENAEGKGLAEEAAVDLKLRLRLIPLKLGMGGKDWLRSLTQQMSEFWSRVFHLEYTIFLQSCTEQVERNYIKEKKAAVKEFEDKKVELKENLIAELEEKKKMIENEKLTMELTGDSMEVKPIMTRKLRRRPNDPVPIPDKRRKPLNYLLTDEQIMEDLRTLNKLKSPKRPASPSSPEHLPTTPAESPAQRFEARIEDGKLYYDKRWYHKSQAIYLESKDNQKLSCVISSVGANEIWVRKTSDSTKMRIYLGQLQRGLFVIRRRSAA